MKKELDMYGIAYNTRKFIRLIVWWPIKLLALIWPRDRNLVVFGAWMGDMFLDNPKYFLLYLLEHSDFKCVWIGRERVRDKLPMHHNVRFAKKGSLTATFMLLRARTWVFCQSIEQDFTKLPLCGSALTINFWHGIPLKHIGRLSPWVQSFGDEPWFSYMVKRVTAMPTSWHSASSRMMGTILPEDSPDLFSTSKMLYFGSPRNDYLIAHRDDLVLKNALRLKYSRLLGFRDDSKIVCYLPTWRRSGDYVKTFYGLPSDEQIKWNSMLGDGNAVLIEKHHYRTYEDYPLTGCSRCSITVGSNIQGEIDTQEMLLITDVLISDYSGAYVDFGLLRRPCIHFANDLENYRANDSGLIYEYEKVVAGPIVKTFDELYEAVKTSLINPEFSPAEGYQSLVEYETGSACKQMLDFIKESV